MAQTTTNIETCWGPWQAAVSSRPAGQQASRPKGLIFSRELPKVPRNLKKNRRFLWGSNPPQGGWLGGGQGPQHFSMLVVVWAMAGSSEQQASRPAGQQASRPKGQIFSRELPKVPRKFKKNRVFLWGSSPPQGGWLGGPRAPTFFNVGGCLGHGRQQ